MSKRSKKAGLLLAGVVVVAVIAIATWSGMSSAESSGESGSNSFAVGTGEESPDDLQSAGSVTRSSPQQSTRGGSRLQDAGQLAPGEDGTAAADEVQKKTRRKKKGRRPRKSVLEEEEEAAKKKAAPKRPLPGI